MTKEEAEPIILDLFYRDESLKREQSFDDGKNWHDLRLRIDLTPREKEAAELWDNEIIKVKEGDYSIALMGSYLCFLEQKDFIYSYSGMFIPVRKTEESFHQDELI